MVYPQQTCKFQLTGDEGKGGRDTVRKSGHKTTLGFALLSIVASEKMRYKGSVRWVRMPGWSRLTIQFCDCLRHRP